MSEKKTKARQRLTDEQWEEIEVLYRANQISLTQIAKRFGITSAAISMRAERKGWKRNLGKQVRDEVKKRVSQALPGIDESDQRFQDACIVEEAADLGVNLVRSHIRTLANYMELVQEFVLKLRSAKDKMDPREWAITLNNAVSALEKLIKLERQAVNLDEKQETSGEAGDKVANLIDYIHSNGSRDETVIDVVEENNKNG